MASSLRLHRQGAVGFIVWLDFRALLRDEFIIKFALAAYHLPAANWTSFYVTTEDVNLAFPDAAVVTGLPICSPVLFLISIANAVEFLASDAEARLNRVVHHGLINLTTQAQRPGPRDAWIATGAHRPGSLQRMVRRWGFRGRI
jgi:hypothetical protein